MIVGAIDHDWWGQLISSYLTNRKQYVKVNNEVSDLIEVISGVPQGSKLGPLFFITFINDLPEHLTEVIYYGFADDMKLIREAMQYWNRSF